jgi:uracil-DNA glycosylase
VADDRRSLLQDARQLLEQEKVWDEYVSIGSPPVAAGNDEKKATRSTPPSSSPAVVGGGPIVGSPPVAAGNDAKRVALQALHHQYKDCVACPLGATRIKFVFGVGRADADVLFIGEGPGYEEDRRGEPFVGKAGQLLDKMLAAIHLDRSQVYIANIVKCHPMVNPETPDARGNDRAPSTLESETCAPILKQQISVIQPRIIVTLGSPSTRAILQTGDGITKLRGRFFPFPVEAHYDLTFSAEQRAALAPIRVLPMYHPAALLRNPNLKIEAWEDMKLLRDTLAARF